MKFKTVLVLYSIEMIAAGYIIGKNDIDVRVRKAIRSASDQFIGYVKAVPPANMQPMLPGMDSKVGIRTG